MEIMKWIEVFKEWVMEGGDFIDLPFDFSDPNWEKASKIWRNSLPNYIGRACQCVNTSVPLEDVVNEIVMKCRQQA